MAFRLASLVVELAADGAKLTRELSNSRKRTSAWARAINTTAIRAAKSFGVVAASVASIDAAMTAVYVSQARSIDQMAKNARKLGSDIGEVETAALAFELSGVGFDTAAMATQRFSRRVAEAVQGSGEAVGAIEELGLSAVELSRMRPEQGVEAVLRAMQEIPNEKDRVRLAMKFFDSEGVALVNATGEAFDQARREIERMGGAITTVDAARVEAANDAVTLLQTAARVAGRRLTVELAPAVEQVALALYESSVQGDQFEKIIKQVAETSLRAVSTTAISVGQILQYIGQNPAIGQFGVLGLLIFGRKGALIGAVIGQIYEKFNEVTGGIRGRLESQIAMLEQEVEQLEGAVDSQTEIGRKWRELLGSDYSDQLAARREELAALRGELLQLDDTTGTSSFGDLAGALGEGMVAAGQAINDALNAPLDAAAAKLQAVRTSVVDLGSAAESANDARAFSLFDGLSEEDSAVAESYIDQQRALAEKANVVVADVYREYSAKILAERQAALGVWAGIEKKSAIERTAIIAGELENTAANVAQYSRTAFEISKAAGIASAVASTWIAAAAAMETKPFWPLGLAAWAKAIALGTTAVTKIRQTRVGTTSVGGSPSTGGLTANIPTASPGASSDNQAELDAGVQNSIVPLPVIVPRPGASERERADDIAQALALASELDLARVNADGTIDYTGSGTQFYQVGAGA